MHFVVHFLTIYRTHDSRIWLHLPGIVQKERNEKLIELYEQSK